MVSVVLTQFRQFGKLERLGNPAWHNIKKNMDKATYLAGSPLGSLINDFAAIPADTDLRELVFASYVEIDPAAWSGEMEQGE